MLPMPHTSYRLFELHHRHLRAEMQRLRQGQHSPTRLIPIRSGAWHHLCLWAGRWQSSVQWPRPWRWSST